MKIIANIVLILIYFLGINLKNNCYLTIILLLLMCGGVYIVLNSIFEIKIFVIFILLYPYNFLLYLLFDKKLSVYTEYYTFENLYFTGLTIFLFVSLLLYNLGVIAVDKNQKLFSNHEKSGLIFYICLGCIAYLMFTGMEGTLGNYGEIKLTPKIEYLIVPYIILSLFCSNRKRKLITIIYMVYSVYLLLCGSRVPVLFLIYTILIINKKLFYHIRNNKGLILVLGGILLMKFVEKTRSGQGSYFERISHIFSLKSSNIIVNNEADVIYAGTALIGLIQKKILTFTDTIHTWIYMLTDLFRLNIYRENLMIPVQVNNNTLIGGGGIFSTQLYFLGREFLIITVAIFIANCIRKLYLENNRSITKNIYSLIVLITVFRWFPYIGTPLYKMSSYTLIFYYACRKIAVTIRKRGMI